jgi:hypothetical protein
VSHLRIVEVFELQSISKMSQPPHLDLGSTGLVEGRFGRRNRSLKMPQIFSDGSFKPRVSNYWSSIFLKTNRFGNLKGDYFRGDTTFVPSSIR